MSDQYRKDFDDRLAELSNWQIQQQKKLKAFQEAQRRLLDLEHQNILNSLRTQNFEEKNDRSLECVGSNLFEKYEKEHSCDLERNENKETEGLFQLKYQPIKLNEPKSSIYNIKSCAVENSADFSNKLVASQDESKVLQPRKFLKRGEGLARFKMTLDDFKGPPKIYKEKKIKTYLNIKPDYSNKNVNSKNIKCSKKCNKGSRSFQPKVQSKSVSVPVKIYMPETKIKQCNSIKNVEIKQSKSSKRHSSLNLPKTPVQDLVFKPNKIATEWYNVMKEKEESVLRNEKPQEIANSLESTDLEIEKKRDEKELQIFEILEKKIDNTSFCSTSSFIDKLMEQSLTSTPSKSFPNDSQKNLYIQGLKSLQSQFLDLEQIKKYEEFCDFPLETISDKSKSEIDEVVEYVAQDRGVMIDDIEDRDIVKEKREDEEELNNGYSPKNEAHEKEPKCLQPHKVNKTLLQEYIKDFKKFKHILAENVHRIEEPEEENEQENESKKEVPINHHDIELKLQRKGLQDNVKQILNWECPQRKRQPKRVVKKIKPKPKVEKPKVQKEQSEKIIFDSTLLKMRLEELEKEIEIFRKENKNLEVLQKECNEERMKLAKEKKEFEKQMQEEREKFELKMTEEQKKLQKERTVFEKYCKQVKSQPTRQEREEMANLKKELEKITETMSTKESRWGASQARLRNQIKNLEKENSQLKAEIEKYKKASLRKVSFENDKSINAKIINVINSELGKLKPSVIKNSNGGTKNQSLSARVERNVEEQPIRRIKSVPNMKKQVEVEVCTETFNEYDEKALGSVSTDSGIETNGFRYLRMARVEAPEGRCESSKCRDLMEDTENTCISPAFEHLFDYPAVGKSTENTSNDQFESASHEPLFGNDEIQTTNLKISEIKNRIQRLNLHNYIEEKSDCNSTRMGRLPKETSNSCRSSESEEDSGSLSEEENSEKQRVEIEKIDNCCGRSRTLSKTDSVGKYPCSINSIIESRLDESGIREKVFEDGSKEITYPNGNVKKIFPGNKIVRMVYYNGDIKETNVLEGSEKYYYAETKTWHTTYKDGLEVLEFPNGQTERRHANGLTEISFPNGCVRYCDSSGRDEWRFSDGTVIKTNERGHKILLMPNGQKEIHTKEFKVARVLERREYPDGSVKILYADGTQETRYSSGRVRLKDKDGNLLMDSGGIR